MGKTSYDFLEVLRDTIDDKVSTLDQTIYCKIAGINEDYTLDVTVLPDDHTRIKSVVNASKYSFNVGDYGILYKIGNNLANAFIIAKLGPSADDSRPLGQQTKSGDGGGDTIINNYYQTIVSSATYTHSQDTPSALWAINHNMDKFPSVTVVTSAGDIAAGGEIDYIDSNNLTIGFAAAFSGKAYLN